MPEKDIFYVEGGEWLGVEAWQLQGSMGLQHFKQLTDKNGYSEQDALKEIKGGLIRAFVEINYIAED